MNNPSASTIHNVPLEERASDAKICNPLSVWSGFSSSNSWPCLSLRGTLWPPWVLELCDGLNNGAFQRFSGNLTNHSGEPGRDESVSLQPRCRLSSV